jgi:hypothetical protein
MGAFVAPFLLMAFGEMQLSQISWNEALGFAQFFKA